MTSLLQTPEDVARFIRAGRAIITLRSVKTGQHYTYKVTRKEDGAKVVYFVNLLTGPDNEADYTYIGLLTDDEVAMTRKSKMTCDSPPVKAINYAVRHVARGQMPPDCEVRHEGRCGVCARVLTVPESIDRGIGPECWSKMI